MISGRWDLTIQDADKTYPSWVQLSADGGWFVGEVGSARPIKQVDLETTKVRWQLKKQNEGREDDLVFTGELIDGVLEGSTTNDKGEVISWAGVRAPELPHRDVTWAAGKELIGPDLSNWIVRWPEMSNQWSITEHGLDNAARGTDLITVEKFDDFKLIAEYRYPKDSNSGIYLRGRYELQILDDHGTEPHVGGSGAIYGFIEPTTNSIHRHDEWNRAEITFIGRFVTVVLNEVTIIDNVEIPGITGGALDSAEGEPGPILVQGDHGPVTFRRLTIHRPA